MQPNFLYMLAPMDDLTNSCFRSVCHGADLTFTELVSIESLARNNATALERIRLYDHTPTAIQIIGQREEPLEKFLSEFSPDIGFQGFNLNMGCPDPNFVTQGLGCAMIKRISKTKRIIGIIKSHGYTASIKMRLGLNQYERDKKAYLNLINGVDADFFVVHARHGMQTYGEKAYWSVFPECVKTGKNIIANGDIKTKDDVEKMKEFGCKGVMIGRAAIINPLIFAELKGMAAPSLDELKSEYTGLLKARGAHPKYGKNVFKFLGKDNAKIGQGSSEISSHIQL